MRRSLLLIAAAFAAGLGLGYMLQPEPAVDRAARREPAAAWVATPSGSSAAPREATPPPALPDVPAGDGRIRGRVTDEDGKPLEGALVLASPVAEGPPMKGRKGAAGPPDRDLDEMARDLVTRERWRREARRTARSSADGTYEVAGLGAVKWKLNAFKDGYHLQPKGSNAYSLDPGAVVDFVGGTIVRLDVDVRLPDGSPPTMTWIYAEIASGNSTTTTSEVWIPSEPWIELRPGAYTLSAVADNGAKSQSQTARIEAGKATSLSFQLEDRPGLRVKVIPPEDLRPTTLEVLAMRFAGGSPPDPARLRGEGRRNSLHGGGEFIAAWQDLEPGSYLIGAAYSSSDGASIEATKVVQVGQGTAEHELRLPAIDPKHFLVVRVQDADGDRVEDAQIGLAYLAPRRMSSRGGNAIARTDGAYLVRRQQEEAESGGLYYVTAHSRRLGRVEQAYDPADPREITLVFDRPAFVDVTIAGYVESACAGWLGLSLREKGEKSRSGGYEKKPQPEGRCRLGPVQPGSYDIVIYSLPDANSSWPASVVPVDLRSGERALTVEIPTLYTLTVRWPGKGSRSIGVGRKDINAGWLNRTLTTDVVTIERVPAGVYEIRPNGHPSAQAAEVEVPKQTEATIK